MKFSYHKLENYNKEVTRQRRYFKYCLGIFGYVILFIAYNATTRSKKAVGNDINNHDMDPVAASIANRGTGKGVLEYFTVWTYPVPPPREEVDETLFDEKLYCSYAPCAPIDEDQNFYHEPYVLNLRQMIGKSKQKSKAFEEFVAHHSWYKFLHGANFPHHVQSVAILSIINAHQNACVRTLGQGTDTTVCTADAKRFKDYDPTDANSVPPFAVQFMDMTQRYGILDYTGLIDELQESDLENEMQSLSSLLFLPYLTDLVDIKRGLPQFEGNIIMNGWYGGSMAYPPGEKATVTMTSVHLDNSMIDTVRDNREFLDSYNSKVGPIGAADTFTNTYLLNLGVASYLSSTFTSMMSLEDYDEKEIAKKKRDSTSIVIVDYHDDVHPGLIPDKILSKATIIHTRGSLMNNSSTRFKQTFELMKTIASAKVVICFKIQTAFLAMANGAKVILVGDIHDMDSAAHGNAHLFNRQSPSDEWNHDIDKLGVNAESVHTFDRYRASFLQQMKSRSFTYYDTANLFGMMPLQRVGRGTDYTLEYEEHNHFQFVITTPPNTVSWQMLRTIESVYFFHPNAKVVVHSNTISSRNSNLDIFVDAGYDFEIRPYSFEEMFANGVPFIDESIKVLFLDKLMLQMKQQHWYSHEVDLIRMLLLERDGGVMMDTDMHLVKALPKSFTNVAAWRDEEKEKIGVAMLVFEKNNPFLRKMIIDAIDISNNRYQSDWYDIFGQDLITEHYLRQKGSKDIKVLTHEVFYPFVNEGDCLTVDKTVSNPIDETFTFGVHMKNIPFEERITIGVQVRTEQLMNKPEPGSVCDELLREHCIFCGVLDW